MRAADAHYGRSKPESEPGDTCPCCGEGELFMLASRPALACDTCQYEEDWNDG
jgi:uncharacterized protein (DUF983 family)